MISNEYVNINGTILTHVLTYFDNQGYYLEGKLVVSDEITSIGGSAFTDSALTEIILPDTITSIGDGAFWYVPITSITIPKSVTSIGSEVFEYTPLTDVYYEGTLDEWYLIDIDANNDKLFNINIHFSGELDEDFGLRDSNGNFTDWKILLVSGKLVVNNNELTYVNSSLTGELIIPNTITSIGSQFLYGTYSFINGNINYSGTMEEWNSITKADDWHFVLDDSGIELLYLKTVTCSDGTINL